MDYLGKKLGLLFRKELTDYFNKRYIKDLVFFQMTQIDKRICNPDQRLTDDINKWSDSLASLYSNVTKPILDIVMFTKKLSVLLGYEGPGIIFAWYLFCAVVMKNIAPPFGKMMAKLSNLEGEYRSHHFDVLSHSEEIAFYNGSAWEQNKASDGYKKV